MNKLARLLALVLALALCVAPGFSALAEEAAATPEVTATEEPFVAVTEDPNAVVITVNGQEVMRSEVEGYASYLLSMYSEYGYDTTDSALVEFVNQEAYVVALQETLIMQKIAEFGYDQFTEEERAQIEADNKAEWESAVDMYVEYYGGLTEESTEEEIAAARVNVLAMLESMGYTEAGQLQYALESAAYEKLEAEMGKGAVVTDEEVQAAFDEYVKADEASYKEDIAAYEYMTQYYGETSYYIPEGYRGITHILLEVDDALLTEYEELNAKLEEQQEAEEAAATATAAPETEQTAETEEAGEADAAATEEIPVTQADVDAAYAAIIASVQLTIDEINAKLAEGASFADLIVEYGTDPGMQQEPYKSEGYNVHMDSIAWDPAFVKAAFSVNNVGEVAQPVVGSYGVHIVQYTRDVPSGAVEMTEEVKNTIYTELLTTKESEMISATMDQWISEAVVVTHTAQAEAALATDDAAEEEAAE